MTGEGADRLKIFEPEKNGLRADVYIQEQYSDISRAQIKRWFEQGWVTIGGQAIKAGEKTRMGRPIALVMEKPDDPIERPRATAMDLDIRYEDEYLLVLNKPQGLVVHPAAGHAHDTLVNGLLYHYGEGLSDWQGAFRPGIVHRLDKDSSGLLMVVKDKHTHAKLAEAIKKHEVKRHYVALVYGQVKDESGSIIAPVGRSAHDRQRMTVRADGKPATTHFTLRRQLRGMSLLDIDLETGRTHQIRVHMNYIGHPVLADPVYAGKRERYGLKGQALHASALDFVHPITAQWIHVEAELPSYMMELIERMGGA